MSEGIQQQEPDENGVRKAREKNREGFFLDLSTFPEDDMFAILLNDALKGVDIRKAYPALYRQLMADEVLWQVFVESLEALETPLAELPQPTRKPDLSFLKTSAVTVDVEPIAPGRWAIQFKKTAQQLYEILFAPPPQLVPVSRTSRAMMMEEENDITLLSETVVAGEVSLAVSLNVRQSVATPDELGVQLVIWPTGENRAFPEVTGKVVWGTYVEEVRVQKPGRVNLPSLPYQAIHTAVQANLYLNVDVTSTQ